MIIGLVLLCVTVALLFFGVAQRIFKSFGMAYWLAFVMVGVFIGCAFIPTFSIGGVSVNAAGFLAPAAFSVVFAALCVRVREWRRAVVAAVTVTAAYVAVVLLLSPLIQTVFVTLISGFLCGFVAYLVGKTELAAVCAAFIGIPIGDIAASAVDMYVYGAGLRLGSPLAFDALILAAVFAITVKECVSAIKRRSDKKRLAFAEAAEEFDPEEYKKYFDE